jgi:hypothetical protein
MAYSRGNALHPEVSGSVGGWLVAVVIKRSLNCHLSSASSARRTFGFEISLFEFLAAHGTRTSSAYL